MHQFYNDAFVNLLVLVGIILSFAGIFVPLGIAFFQTRQQKKEGQLTRDKLESQIASAVREIEERLKEDQAKSLVAFSERSDALLKALRIEVQNKLCAVEAGTFHIQANTSGPPVLKAESAADAIELYFVGKDFANLRKVAAILEQNLGKLSKDDLKKRPELQVSCDKALAALKSGNEHGVFEDLISKIGKALGEASERETKAE